MREVEYGVTCGFVRLCDRPRGHDGEHGMWVETTIDRIRATEAARYRGLVDDINLRLDAALMEANYAPMYYEGLRRAQRAVERAALAENPAPATDEDEQDVADAREVLARVSEEGTVPWETVKQQMHPKPTNVPAIDEAMVERVAATLAIQFPWTMEVCKPLARAALAVITEEEGADA